MKMEQTECSETSAYKIQTPRNNPEKKIQHSQKAKIWNQEDMTKLIVAFRNFANASKKQIVSYKRN
jgi:hypothetical protein